MTDYTGNVTGSVVNANAQRSDDSIGRWEMKKITFTAAAVGATGTHNLITLPAKTAVLGGYFVITTVLASTSNDGTIAFGGQTGMNAAVIADNTECAAGDVIQFNHMDLEDVVGMANYSATADTFDITVATHDITSGEGYLFLHYVTLDEE